MQDPGDIPRDARELEVLYRLALDLEAAAGLPAVAQGAARAVSELLGGRGVLVLLHAPGTRTEVRAAHGPEMSARLLTEPIGPEGESLGEVVVDVGPGLELDGLRLVQRVAGHAHHAAARIARESSEAREWEGLLVAITELLDLRRGDGAAQRGRRLVEEALGTDGGDALARWAPLALLPELLVPEALLAASEPGERSVIAASCHALGARALVEALERAPAGPRLDLAREVAAAALDHARWA